MSYNPKKSAFDFLRQVLHDAMSNLLTFWTKKGKFYIVALSAGLPQPANSQQPPAVSRRPQTPAAASNRANNLSQPQTTVYSRRQQPSASIRQHRIGAAWIASVRLPLAIRMSGEGLYARQHKKPLSMTGKTVRLRGFRAYIKALSFLSIVVLLKSSFVFGEDCIFDFVPCF